MGVKVIIKLIKSIWFKQTFVYEHTHNIYMQVIHNKTIFALVSGSARTEKADTEISRYKFSVQVPLHNDGIRWEYFPCYWLFVRGIHRLPVDSSHKGQWR